MPHVPFKRLAALTLPAIALAARAAGAQLSLADAFRRADQAAYPNRVAAGNAAAQRAQALAPLRGIVPAVRLDAGYVRTTDPIGVFGSTLRQRGITQENFDPQRLNYPGALGNYQAGIVLEQPLFNADAWAGRRSATHAADAARGAEDWTRLSTRVDVVRAYYGVALAAERVATLRAAARAAHAHVSEAESMVRQGVATKSDALLASVRAGDVDVQLAEAEGAMTSARRRLALLLGGDGTDAPGAAAAMRLPAAARIVAEIARDTADVATQPRRDVAAASDALAAASADALRARSTLLPRLNGFLRYDWNSATAPYAGEHNWTAGLMASWNLFAGPGEMADVRATRSRVSAAEAQAEAARATARVEVDETRTALIVALTRLAVAERAVAQSAEAHRIIGRKYAGGLATVVELLDGQAIETQSMLSLAQARWTAIVAAADRRRALGLDPATLSALDDATTVAAPDSAGGLTNSDR